MSLPRSLARTLAMTRKEGLHIVRDTRSLIMALAVPVLMLTLFGYALTLDVDRIQTLVYDQDQTPQSRELIARFAGSRYFQMLGSVDEYRTIERAINSGRCLLAVVIPKDYGRHLLASQEADVQLLLDGSDSNTSSITLGYANALTRAYAFELQTKDGPEWKTFYRGKAIGRNREVKFDPVTARFVRLNITEGQGGPTIYEFQLFAPVAHKVAP